MSIPLFVSEGSKPELSVRPLSVGCLIFEQMDQIDFAGPFEVLSRMPDTTIQVIAKEVAPVREVQGLRLSPDMKIAEAALFDVLLVPGGQASVTQMAKGQLCGPLEFRLRRTVRRLDGKTSDDRRQIPCVVIHVDFLRQLSALSCFDKALP